MHLPAVVTSLCTLGLALGACANAPGSQIEADWGATMKRYNLIGLYPITEDRSPGMSCSMSSRVGAPSRGRGCSG